MFVGREFELLQLKNLKKSSRSELAIIYGRRRIGKSTLLEHLATEKSDYYFEAIKGFSKAEQIGHFLKQMQEINHKNITKASSWEDAFDQLTPHILKGKHLIVFDEFPWMANERTELVAILKYYWDRKWKKNPGLKLILCGSVANFMIKHLVHSEALHNRKTLEMKVESLSAREAQGFFRGKRSQFEISKFLMIFGGVPKYLEQVNPDNSFEQNLDNLCFIKNSFFTNEFETIFKEQFKVVKKYETIVELLSGGSKTKEELQQITGSSRGGGFGKTLEQLEIAGLIKSENSLNLENQVRKSKTKKYKIWDEWLRFYFNYQKRNKALIHGQSKPGLAGRLIENSISSYLGIGFEIFCQKNIPQILQHLNIDPASIVDIGPYFRQASRSSSKPGVQFDLCLVRKGGIISFIECKYKQNPVGVEVIQEMEEKFKKLNISKRITIEKILISASGVTNELEQRSYFHHILGLDAIFN